MTITQEQRKFIWISAVVLAVIYFTPYIVTALMQIVYMPQAAQVRQIPAPPGTGRGPLPASSPAPPPPAPFRDLLGQYSGSATLATRGICALRFELRDNREKPGVFSGYSTLACTPLGLPEYNRPNADLSAMLMMRLKPTSAILTGAAEDDAIRFHVDDTISSPDGCAPTEFTVKPFGTNQMAVEWQDSCHGGAIVLNRTGR